ncbi:MAG: FecR family protein [Chitinophagaceae bacterium]|nr:MAG: FecR family protein [Chitinophagaceae bacterium]
MCNDRIWILMTRKLSGEATSTELKELDMLLSPLPEGNNIFTKITGVWNEVPAHDSDFMEATYLAHLERMKDKGVELANNEALVEVEELATEPASDRWFSVGRLSFMVVLMLVMLSGWFLLSSKKSSDKSLFASEKFKEIQTRKGARTKIKLPDGSDVWLNAGSKLNFDKNFEGDTREVYLTGEAYFDVVHNAEKPFIIHTTKINVKVLGTRFNVKAYEGDKTTETSLIKGSVEVFLKSDPNKKYLLKPNQKLVLSNETAIASETIASRAAVNPLQFNPKVAITELSYLHDEKADVESSWTRNILSFEDELFSEVAKKMERWYDVTIVFKNKRWEREYMSGSFEQEDLEQALIALKYSTGFNFKTDGKTVTIY